MSGFAIWKRRACRHIAICDNSIYIYTYEYAEYIEFDDDMHDVALSFVAVNVVLTI